MPTEKLYENDSYLSEFNAKIISIEPTGELYNVILDRTAFFPEGGGQAADIGFIDDAKVLDVQNNDGIIYHKIDKFIVEGSIICGKVDIGVRFPRMQNHSGEHIVSGVIFNHFGFNNVGFHMGAECITLDTSGVLTSENIDMIEKEANEVVWKNVPVRAYYPEPEELKNMTYRSKLALETDVRIVEIEGVDKCACCVPHVARTGEIGLIKILSFCPFKGGTRIEMICGSTALEDYIMLHNQNGDIMKQLSAKRMETPKEVKRCMDNADKLKEEIKELKEKLAFATLNTTECGNLLIGTLRDSVFSEMTVCINRLKAEKAGFETIVLLSENREEILYMAASEGTSGNAKKISAMLNREFNGKGGGRDNFAQGKIKGEMDKIVGNVKGAM